MALKPALDQIEFNAPCRFKTFVLCATAGPNCKQAEADFFRGKSGNYFQANWSTEGNKLMFKFEHFLRKQGVDVDANKQLITSGATRRLPAGRKCL